MFEKFILNLLAIMVVFMILFGMILNDQKLEEENLQKKISSLKESISLKMNLPEKVKTESTFCSMINGKPSYEEKMTCAEVSKPTVCQTIQGEYYFCKEQPDLSEELSKI